MAAALSTRAMGKLKAPAAASVHGRANPTAAELDEANDVISRMKVAGILRNDGKGRPLASGRPWHVLLFAYGFLNHIIALQFEASWQRGFAAACMRHVLRFTPSRGPAGKIEILRALLSAVAWRDMRLSVHLVDTMPDPSTLFAPMCGYRLLTRGPHH